jgi:hypothetical protein
MQKLQKVFSLLVITMLSLGQASACDLLVQIISNSDTHSIESIQANAVTPVLKDLGYDIKAISSSKYGIEKKQAQIVERILKSVDRKKADDAPKACIVKDENIQLTERLNIAENNLKILEVRVDGYTDGQDCESTVLTSDSKEALIKKFAICEEKQVRAAIQADIKAAL